MPRKSRAETPDALALLKADHASVKKSFKDFEKMDHEDTDAIKEFVQAVCNELKVHTTIEEEIFYPAVRRKIDDEDLMNEALVEHASAKDLIRQLEKMEAEDPLFVATFKVLAEYVTHHIKEEEGEIFPGTKRLKLDLEALARQMMERREELVVAT